MKKDVIYVDIEDDITSIIEKVKTAQAKIVALVPPKRIGVLQSIVNLKLLQRAAEAADKRVVLITNDASLSSLAAGVMIPVAKNLQSKPEIAPITTLEVDDEDIINGDELPIGELASTAPDATLSARETAPQPSVTPVATPAAALAASKAPKKGPKIPNFDSMRKKIFIFGGLGVLLIGFLIWAIFFASSAVVSITARTTPYSINKQLNIAPNATFDASEGTLPLTTKEQQKTVSVDFTPTGKKEVGDKAKGMVKIETSATVILVSGLTVPAGTTIESSSGLIFYTDSPAVFAKGDADGLDGVTVGVTAADPGTKYNGASGSASTDVQGVTSVTFTSNSSGGTDKTATVVTADDIAKAQEKLTEQDANAVKTDLKKEFDDTFIVIDESFVVTAGTPTSTPALDQEATSAKLTVETKYSMSGVKRANVDTVLKEDITGQLEGLPNQKIYASGIDAIRFNSFQAGENGAATVRLIATGYVGPNIDSDKLAKSIEGKRAGEIQAIVQAIDGVESVDVKLSPFWVNTAPSADKTTVKFLVENETN